MLAVRDYRQLRQQLAERFRRRHAGGRTCREYLVGILFAPPMTAAGRQILARLDDYHFQSADDTDFFLAGYGAYWDMDAERLLEPPGSAEATRTRAPSGKARRALARGEEVEDEDEGDEAPHPSPDEWLRGQAWLRDPKDGRAVVVATTTDRSSPDRSRQIKWLYSPELFYALVDDVQRVAPGWTYSNEADLLLADAVYDPRADQADVDFRTAVHLDLERLVTDKAVDSIPRLFAEIFRFTKQARCDYPTWRFSDTLGWGVGRRWLEDVLLDKLPLKVGRLWKEGRHYAVRDLTKA